MTTRQRLLLIICVAICLSGTLFLTPASACEGGVTVEATDRFGQVVQTIRCPSGAGGQGQSAGVAAGGESRTCNSPTGAVIPCSSELGSWNGERGCYSRVSPDQNAIPIDPALAEEWVLMQCTRLSGLETYFLSQRDEPSPPDPRALAQTAISRMGLAAIRIGSFPHTVDRSPMSLGVVGRNVWMWVDGATASTFGPITQSVTERGFTVTATAEVVEVVWDMGNGDSVSCGEGTPYPASTDDDPASPDCGYVYTTDGHYLITATTHWAINWAGIGQAGTIPMQLTTSETLSIAEIQVVNIPVRQP